MRDILSKMKVAELKKEISKTNIKGYSKMKKSELIDLMVKNKEKFTHLSKGAPAPKVEPAKAKPKKKAEPKKKVKLTKEDLREDLENDKKLGGSFTFDDYRRDYMNNQPTANTEKQMEKLSAKADKEVFKQLFKYYSDKGTLKGFKLKV